MKLTRKEIKDMVALDALCFDPPINYVFRDLAIYTGVKNAVLIREYEGERLIAFCLGDADSGNIITIDVHPDFRRRGLGRKLLKTILDEFKSRKTSFAISQIALDNLPSIKLHQDFGFEIRQILHEYYADGKSAYELVLPLNPPAGKKIRHR
ncbi:GNAT family N-acetyltransferase [Candidatus Sumerlaeota bacterium]|nr:GNAT family N-acetyltransferase [Candidatus Sumerlaeota bacterium]